MFEAILIETNETGQTAHLAKVGEDALPEGDVTVRVACSTLNYKDALAITGKSPVVRRFPMIPGIDLAGVVEASDNPDWKPGDKVVLNGWGVGETHCGGLAQKARLKGEWLVPLEPAFSMSQAMAIGTAGYTAMLCPGAREARRDAGRRSGAGHRRRRRRREASRWRCCRSWAMRSLRSRAAPRKATTSKALAPPTSSRALNSRSPAARLARSAGPGRWMWRAARSWRTCRKSSQLLRYSAARANERLMTCRPRHNLAAIGSGPIKRPRLVVRTRVMTYGDTSASDWNAR